MPLTTTGRNGLLDTGKTSLAYISALTNITATPTEATGVTRQAITWAAAASGVVTNGATTITIPVGAGNTVVALGFYSALTAGNYLGYFPLGSSGQYVDGVATVNTSGTFTSVAHGLVADDRVFFSTVAGESLPTGASFDAVSIYYVRATGLTADSFTIATTSGGAALTFTTAGEVSFFKTVPNTFASAGNLTIGNNALTLDATFA